MLSVTCGYDYASGGEIEGLPNRILLVVALRADLWISCAFVLVINFAISSLLPHTLQYLTALLFSLKCDRLALIGIDPVLLGAASRRIVV